MKKNKNNIFTHFKIQYKKKIIFFYKICMNFPYLKRSPQKPWRKNNFGKSTLHLA